MTVAAAARQVLAQVGEREIGTQSHLVEQVVALTGCPPAYAKRQLATQQRRRRHGGGWTDGRRENALKASAAAKEAGTAGRPPKTFEVRDGQVLHVYVYDAAGNTLADEDAQIVGIERDGVEIDTGLVRIVISDIPS